MNVPPVMIPEIFTIFAESPVTAARRAESVVTLRQVYTRLGPTRSRNDKDAKAYVVVDPPVPPVVPPF